MREACEAAETHMLRESWGRKMASLGGSSELNVWTLAMMGGILRACSVQGI
jgi:hypothetical protein